MRLITVSPVHTQSQMVYCLGSSLLQPVATYMSNYMLSDPKRINGTSKNLRTQSWDMIMLQAYTWPCSLLTSCAKSMATCTEY
jgi:hypothetical protein